MKYFFNYRLQKEKEFNYKNILAKDLNLLNEEKPLINVNNQIYEELKEFYEYYNFDSIPKTFTEGIYSKYKFDYLKIITHRDLKSALPEYYEKAINEIGNTSKSKKNLLNNNFFYILYLLNFDSPSNKFINKQIITENKPITWGLFYKVFGDFIADKNLDDKEFEINMRHFEKRLKNKELDFEYYSEIYKKTKRNLFYSMIRDLFFSSRDTNTSVLE
jgi:hypothetical protein